MFAFEQLTRRSVQFFLAAIMVPALTAANEITITSDQLHAFDWRFVGPQGNRVSAVVCEVIGKQMEDLDIILVRTSGTVALRDALAEVSGELVSVEDKLLQRQLHASDPKSYREQMMLLLQATLVLW